MDDQNTNTEGAARKPRMRSPDRSQIDPNPKVLDDLIAPDHPARLVWQLVEELDVTRLREEIKAVEGKAGRPAIDPRILIALWIYATTQGVCSGREVAKRCGDCDPYKWICGGVSVNHHTLSDFRARHTEWLKEQVVRNISTMRWEGLVDLEQIGQDGMRVRASAGNDSFKRAESLEELLEEAEEHWDQLQRQFEQGDGGLSARQRAAQQRAARERVQRLKQAREEVEQVAEQREKRKKGDGKRARTSTTDPEARRMKMGDGGYRPAYNVEFATDVNSLVIVGAELINAGSDAGQMEPMVRQIELEQGPFPANAEYYVDGNFATLADVESVGERGITVFAPVKDPEKQKEKGQNPYEPRPGDTPHVAAWRQRMGTDEARQKYKQP